MPRIPVFYIRCVNFRYTANNLNGDEEFGQWSVFFDYICDTLC